MELMAAIAALEALKRPVPVRVVTDSAYLRNGITTWLHSWKPRGWLTADKKPVMNRDLWERLEQRAGPHQIDWALDHGPRRRPAERARRQAGPRRLRPRPQERAA